MEESRRFHIYRSSAGSGKTTALIKVFLTLALSQPNPGYFKRILAITFTNKAAQELKHRFIEALQKIMRQDREQPPSDFLVADLLRETGLNLEKLQERAVAVFRLALRDYGEIGIGTIDGFNHKLIRSFSRDLKLKSDFEVETDEPKLFREAVDLLLDKVGDNPHITHHLVDYVHYSVEEEKRANVFNKLLDLRSLITSEEARDALGSLKSADESVFEDLKKRLHAHVQAYVKELNEIGQEAVDFMAERGIDHQDLLGGKSGLYKYFGQLATFIDGNKKVNCNQRYHPDTSDSLAKSSLSKSRKALVESCEGQLLRYFQRAEASLEKYPNYQLVKELLKQMDFLAVIKDLSSARDELIAEQNILPISAFNRIISESLRNEPVAFIYEKFGNRYHHVLIDEFQDTSEMQWKNLLPFIVNSLSFGNLNMVVGDAKQSIYRWRGGKAEQLIRLPELDPDDRSISQDTRATIAQNGLIRALDTNYRSLGNIVEFNNSFVEAMTPLWTAENSLFRKEYTGTSATQHYPDGKKGGYVEIRHFNAAIPKEATIRQTMDFIGEAVNDGYEYGDIAILIRKRTKEAVALIEWLHDSGIPVSTVDSFGLDQDEMVVMLAELIRLSTEPDSETAKVKIMRTLCHLHDIPYAPHAYWSIQDKKGKVLLDNFLADYFPDYKREYRDSGSALKIAEWAMAKLIPAELRQSTFLNSFLNHLITEGGRSESPGAFIERWDAMEDKPDATHTSEGNKIRLMTIHKAKGLQFPVVIAFNLNWKPDNNKTIKWVRSKIELPFSHIPLKHVNRMKEQGYAEELSDYRNEVDFDNLNLIYVAITRPSERFYASVSTGKSNETGKRVGEVLTKLSEKWEKKAPLPFHHATLSEGDEDGTCEVYQVGLKEPPRAKQKAKAERSLIKALPPEFMPVEERFSISREALSKPREAGILLHRVAELSANRSEATALIDRWKLNGLITEATASELFELADSLYNDPVYSELLGSHRRLSERSLVGHRSVVRPDVVFRNGKGFVVIDFKTGKPEKKDEEQVREYLSLLKSAWNTEGKAFLLYLPEGRRVAVFEGSNEQGQLF